MSATIQTAMVLIREGVEAFLILAAIRAHLSQLGASSKHWALYLGAACAVLATGATGLYGQPSAYLRYSLVKPLALLLVAGLMLHISGWLFVGSGRSSWSRYIRACAGAMGSKTAGFWIGALAFVVVLREGLETILFVHTTMVQSHSVWMPDIATGVVIGGLYLAILCFVLGRIVSTVPLRFVFLSSSCILFIGGVKLIGTALHQLQDLGRVSRTAVRGEAWLTALGVNPSWEALIVQFGIIVLTAVGFAYGGGAGMQRYFLRNGTGGPSPVASCWRGESHVDRSTGAGGK